MLAIFLGDLSVLIGVALLFLPLLVTELSRPRDSALGALIIVMGLVLITRSDRFVGSPMIAVLFGGLVIGRLGLEVSQNRWQHLTNEEKINLKSLKRWFKSIDQLAKAFGQLAAVLANLMKVFQPKPKSNSTKKWVRPESKTDAKTESLKDIENNSTVVSKDQIKSQPKENL